MADGGGDATPAAVAADLQARKPASLAGKSYRKIK